MMRIRVRKSHNKQWNKGDACISNPTCHKFRIDNNISISASKSDFQDGINKVINDFYKEIHFSYNYAEHGLQSTEFREKLYKIIIALEIEIVQKSFTISPITFVTSIFTLLEAENSDETVFQCLCYLLNAILSHNRDCLIPICPFILKKLSMLTKSMLTQPHYLIHIIKISATVIKRLSDEPPSELLLRFSKSYIKLMSHSDKNILTQIVNFLKVINFSKFIPLQYLTPFLKKRLRNTKTLSQFVATIAAIFTFAGDEATNKSLLQILCDEFMSSEYIRQQLLIEALFVNKDKLINFKSGLKMIFTQFSDIDVIDYDAEYIIKFITFMGKLNVISESNNMESHIKFASTLIKLLEHPSSTVSNTSQSLLSDFFKNIAIPMSAQYTMFLTNTFQHLLNLFLSNPNDNNLISLHHSILDIISYISINNPSISYPTFVNSIPNIIAARTLISSREYINMIDNVFISIIPHIGVTDFLSQFPFSKSTSLMTTEYIWVFELLSKICQHVNESHVILIYSIIHGHYIESVKTQLRANSNNASPSESIYRQMIETLASFFKSLSQQSANIASILDSLHEIFKHDPTIRASVVTAFASSSPSIFDGVPDTTWITSLFDYYLSQPRNNKLLEDIEKAIRVFIYHFNHHVAEDLIHQIQTNSVTSIASKKKHYNDLTFICLPFTSLPFLSQFFTKTLPKTSDKKSNKHFISQTTKFLISLDNHCCVCCHQTLKNDLIQLISNYIKPFLQQYDSFYSAVLLKSGIILVDKGCFGVESLIKFSISTLFQPTSKIITRSRQLFNTLAERSLIDISTFSSQFARFLEEPTLKYGTLELLLVLLQHMEVDSSITTLIIETIWPHKCSFDKRLVKLYTQILFRLRKYITRSDLLEIIEFLVDSSKFFTHKTIQDKAFILIQLGSLQHSIGDLMTKMPTKIKKLRKIVKKMNKIKQKPIKIDNDDSEYDFEENDVGVKPTCFPEGIISIKRKHVDDGEFPLDAQGRMVIEEKDSDSSPLCNVIKESVKEVKISNEKERRTKTGGDKNKGKVEPYMYLPFTKKSLKHKNDKPMGIFKGVCKNKRR